MSGDGLDWLNKWYVSQCNGNWEHTYGVRIDTLDNPGWSLSVDLTETSLAGRSFDRVIHGEPSDDLAEWQRTGSWWLATVTDGIFEAVCGPLDLPVVIDLFRNWAEAPA
jgi:hypothetical protein